MFSTEDEAKDESLTKESEFAQLLREHVIKGDVNTEMPQLGRMVKIIVASMYEGIHSINLKPILLASKYNPGFMCFLHLLSHGRSHLIQSVGTDVNSFFQPFSLDMAEERLILDERIFLELRKFCREQNFDVHIIDINIDDEQFCYNDWKEEIRIAHQETTGLGFIVSLVKIYCKFYYCICLTKLV